MFSGLRSQAPHALGTCIAGGPTQPQDLSPDTPSAEMALRLEWFSLAELLACTMLSSRTCLFLLGGCYQREISLIAKHDQPSFQQTELSIDFSALL